MGDSDETTEALLRSLGVSIDYNPDMDELMRMEVHPVTGQEAAEWKADMDRKFDEWKTAMDDALRVVISTTETPEQVWGAIRQWIGENKYDKEDPRLKYFIDRLPKHVAPEPANALRF